MSKKPGSTSNCANCGWRLKSEENPKTFMAWLWRFHTKFCPGWRAYQRKLANQGKGS